MDRNPGFGMEIDGVSVALRKESVDRNFRGMNIIFCTIVALRKESVDRNFDAVQIIIVVVRRSPQGERG